MIAKTKAEFFNSLKYELERIGIDLTEDIRIDFEEHFAECEEEGVSESEAAERLGDVKEIARNYLDLQSSRINSMVARDVERKISLTKPGQSVPADLSLLKNKRNENMIEYTPEHFSDEIYPRPQNSASSVPRSVTGNNGKPRSAQSAPNAHNAQNVQNAQSGDQGSKANVGEAFSNAGNAIANAAKAAGSAIADAIENSGVKKAVKSAGENVANAVKGIPHPNDSFRQNSNHERRGTIPAGQPRAKSSKGGFKYVDIKNLKPNYKTKKFIKAVLLDVFLWSWLLTLIIFLVIMAIIGGIAFIIAVGLPAVFHISREYVHLYEAVTFFLGIGYCTFGVIISVIGIMLVKPVISLIKFIIEMNIKAIYDL